MYLKGFHHPKHPAKPRTNVPSSGVETNNRLQLLDPATSQITSGEQSTGDKSNKPPAYGIDYIYGIENKYTFKYTLSATCATPPKVRQIFDLICFQAASQADYDKLKSYGVQSNVQFTTDVRKKDRSHKIGLR